MTTMFSSFGIDTFRGSSVDGNATRKVSFFKSLTAGHNQEASEHKSSPLHYGTGWEASLMVTSILTLL